MELTQAGKDIMPYVDMILQGAEQINNYGKSLSEITGSLKLAISDFMQHFIILNQNLIVIQRHNPAIKNCPQHFYRCSITIF